PSPPEISTLSLHDALPISGGLFRAGAAAPAATCGRGCATGRRPAVRRRADRVPPQALHLPPIWRPALRLDQRARPGVERHHPSRSEEHTSELQSLAYLVCR